MMSEVDPLIRRELQWMALGVLENRDLSTIIIAKAKRRRLRTLFIALGSVAALTVVSAGIYAVGFNKTKTVTIVGDSTNNGATGSHDSAATANQVSGLVSDYPLTWEQSIGDLGAISKAAGIGDTLGGLTATGLKVQWSHCSAGTCPTTWILNVKNNTQDIVSVAPALMVYVDHGPLSSSSRPVTVTAGSTALLVFTFPEFAQGLTVGSNSTWQWNWFLTVPR